MCWTHRNLSKYKLNQQPYSLIISKRIHRYEVVEDFISKSNQDLSEQMESQTEESQLVICGALLKQ